jgi:dCMP deaminase
MERPSRTEVMMETARTFSKRSTCSRLHVGAVFARDGRILVTGYNGAPAGLPHCVHLGLLNNTEGCTTAEHAERNGIAFAARHGIKLQGSTVYVTHMPCLACSMSIINAGVEEVIYQEPYRIEDGVRLLARAGVNVLQFDPRDSIDA